ncbi:hypothetical protein Dimus_001171 [Dionaea muscipula]
MALGRSGIELARAPGREGAGQAGRRVGEGAGQATTSGRHGVGQALGLHDPYGPVAQGAHVRAVEHHHLHMRAVERRAAERSSQETQPTATGLVACSLLARAQASRPAASRVRAPPMRAAIGYGQPRPSTSTGNMRSATWCAASGPCGQRCNGPSPPSSWAPSSRVANGMDESRAFLATSDSRSFKYGQLSVGKRGRVTAVVARPN